MSFAKNLKARRIACKMSMEGLAYLVGTSRQTIHRYESGRIAHPPHERVEAIAAVLGVTPSDLMGWEAPSPIPPSREEPDPLPITVTDDAMDADHIYAYDTVCYLPDEDTLDGTIVVVTWDGVPMVRRIWHCPAGDILVASNPAYPPLLVLPEDAHRLVVLGTATVLRTLL